MKVAGKPATNEILKSIRMCIFLHKQADKGRRNLRDEYRSIAQDITWFLLTAFAFLSYALELRLAILSHYGAYATGASDGVVITLAVLAIIFYSKSLKGGVQ